MKCPFCSLDFEEAKGKSGCKGCSIFSQCGKIKCPRCGYEIIPEPEWSNKIRKFFRKEKKI